MHHFFDPSIKPVVTTDLNGNILYVRTYGLSCYGYPDIIMEQIIENYEDIFFAIIDRIFSLEFDISGSWNYDGNVFKLDIVGDGLAKVVFHEVEEVKIITFLNPITGEPAKYKTKSLTNLYNHPEAEISGDTIYGKEILAFMVEQVKEGVMYDEDCSINYEDLCYEFIFTNDRIGKRYIEIRLSMEETKLKGKAKTTFNWVD
ncbi:hypothetical protein GCM10010912_69290 [Paenibacillus albidus]|uniref:Uncharacterized protein n=1 Tax=Paenibacillus albidus TaxID=2041023 RepID=A0A917FZ90_9BACL|nr:hypothetical protein [Paenibacillus albidus]GGG15016.1 hypothetical protein GCM10010912_69290 [Paenibacillus albidus]